MQNVKVLNSSEKNTAEKEAKSFICYEDFGAKGDGVTNDYAAIKRAHDEANKRGLPVFGNPDATYLIGSTANSEGFCESIIIQTNTDWRGAKFVIDDRYIVSNGKILGSESYTRIFEVAPSKKYATDSSVLMEKINKNGGVFYETKNIGFELECDCLLILFNNNRKVYKRYGGNQNSGSVCHDIVLVRKNGDIDPTTPLLFEYPTVTDVKIVPLNEEPLTIENATFESLGNRINIYDTKISNYIFRGIIITRSNTTVKNLTHVITGEIPMGAPVDADGNIVEGYHYSGKMGDRGKGHIINTATGEPVTDGSVKPFLGYSFAAFMSVHDCSDVNIVECTFQARRYYVQGTYDLNMYNANNVTVKDCVQSNFWYEPSTDKFYQNRSDATSNLIVNVGAHPCWGVMGSNDSKNIVYDHSKLVRWDAHEGMVNGKIINGSEVATLRLTGGGEVLIEDSTVYFASSSGVILLREDYGATFKGTVTFRNTNIIGLWSAPPAFFRAMTANHDFGNECYFPNLVVDNVKFTDLDGNPILTEINVASDFQTSLEAPFPYRGVNDPKVHLLGEICADGKPNINVYNPPKFVKVLNNEQNGYKVFIKDYPFFKNTELENVEVKLP